MSALWWIFASGLYALNLTVVYKIAIAIGDYRGFTRGYKQGTDEMRRAAKWAREREERTVRLEREP